MQVNIFVILALCILLSLLAGRIVKLAKLPNVTGYLLMGLLVGPYCLGIIPADMVEQLSLIPEVALGFIALSIGAEFKLSYLKKVGKAPIVIAILEGVGAVLVVDLVLILSGHDVAFSLCLGAIAAATAPAATLMVVKQYKAEGPLTRTLLPVVVIDDAVALIGFGISVAIAKAIQDPSGSSLILALGKPLLEIGGAFLLGGILGILFALLTKHFKSRNNRLSVAVAMVFVTLGLCDMLGLSNLLCCMMMSAVYVNISDVYEQVFELTDRISAPIFMLFFFLSGADLNVGIIAGVGMIGVLYVIFRVVGKVLGAYLGGVICHVEPTVKKYLGYTLIPQAGVAIGLASTAMSVVPEYGAMIQTIILCGTVIYELIGPIATKLALSKAKEIQ
ncbi:cation:proton antiporter [Amedibacillus dolichus]|uniref:cation:proton antiporter n=1 Tax=Amedibacillus dolichus TaxID=31971 RepID=UPI0039A00A56